MEKYLLLASFGASFQIFFCNLRNCIGLSLISTFRYKFAALAAEIFG